MNRNTKKILNSIWKGLEHQRWSGLDSEFYYVFLFLLVLKKKGVIPEFSFKPSEELLQKVDEEVRKCMIPELDEIYQKEYKPRFEKMGFIILNGTLPMLRSIKVEELDEDFPEVFDEVLFRLFEAKGRGQYLIPAKLGELMVSLAEVPENSVVYNPFAGAASFGVYLDESTTYVGQEIDQSIWALGVLRRIAHNQRNGYLLQVDSLNEWIEDTRFDLVISAPPFGKIEHFNDKLDLSIKSCDEFLVKKGINNLSSDGKIVALIPNSFLFSAGAYKALREKLIEKDLIEKIISLPVGILENTGLRTSILIVNRNKKNKEKITLIDGESFQKSGLKKVSLRYEDLHTLVTQEVEGEAKIIVNQEQVRNEDYNLEVKRYFLIEEEIFSNQKVVPLNEILQEIKKNDAAQDVEMKTMISIKHLQNDNLDYKLKPDQVEKNPDPLKNARIISESCLLIARVGRDHKPTYFEFKGESISVSNNIMAFRIVKETIDLDYLFNELHSSFFLKQLSVYQRGFAQVLITKSNFLKIKISLPSPQEQRDKMKGVKEAYIKSRLQEVELQKELLGYKDEAFREFASIKHTFRQYLNALKSNVSGTRKFISKNEGKAIRLDTMYSVNLNRTLGEHLLSLEGTIDSMSRLILEKNLEKGEPEILDPKQLIEEAQNRFKNPEVFQFEEVFVDHSVFASEEGYLNPYIKIPKEGFFRIFANIVYNAVDHGFKNRAGNIIRASVSFDEVHRLVLIEISNNGKPIPGNFTQQHLTTRGEKTTDSSGTGAGGADIKGILQKYNAQFELKKDNESEFPVSYLMKFPLFTMIDKFDLDDFNLDDFEI